MSQQTVSAPQLDMPRPALAQLATMPRVDLMPLEVAEDAALRRLKTGCAAAIVAAAVVVSSLMVQGHNAVQDRKKDLAQAQSEQTAMQSKVASLAHVAATYAAVSSAEELLTQTLGGEVRWSNQLRDLSLTIPANVWLSTMSITPAASAATPAAASSTATTGTAASAASAGVATISFQGVASSRDDVAKWLESITSEKGYTNASYSTSTEQVLGSKIFVNFNSTVTVTAAAQSGRFTNPNGG
jgi:Tfp pilus assembly protein PilN